MNNLGFECDIYHMSNKNIFFFDFESRKKKIKIIEGRKLNIVHFSVASPKLNMFIQSW